MGEGLAIVGFIAVMLVFVGAIVWFVLRSIGSMTGTIKGGLPATATIEQISETGTTISSPEIGPDAPVYQFDLLVTPPAGGAAYPVVVRQAVPRVMLAVVVPGSRVPVDVDPANPAVAKINWSRLGSHGISAAAIAARTGEGQVVEAVRSGSMPVIPGSAAALLASGTRGTAVIDTAMPLGKTTGEVNPNCDPAVALDPIWLFTVDVELPGSGPIKATFGHRVPAAKVAGVAPGVRLAVAVDPDDPSEEVAIDWDASPVIEPVVTTV